MASNFQMVTPFMLIVITIVCGHSMRTRREPEVEAYGLPKRWLKGSNKMDSEHVHLKTRLSAVSEEDNEPNENSSNVTSLMTPSRLRPIIYARPYQILTNNHSDINGVLERVSITSNGSLESLNRRQRSIDQEDETQLEDLDVAEGKIFRPLFAYRQQVAERHKRKRSQNPIYGAYQYRPTIQNPKYIEGNNLKLTRNLN